MLSRSLLISLPHQNGPQLSVRTLVDDRLTMLITHASFNDWIYNRILKSHQTDVHSDRHPHHLCVPGPRGCVLAKSGLDGASGPVGETRQRCTQNPGVHSHAVTDRLGPCCHLTEGSRLPLASRGATVGIE